MRIQQQHTNNTYTNDWNNNPDIVSLLGPLKWGQLIISTRNNGGKLWAPVFSYLKPRPEVFIKIVVRMNMCVLKQSSVTKQRPHFGVNKNSVPYFSVVIDNPIQVCTWSCKSWGFLLEKFPTNTGGWSYEVMQQKENTKTLYAKE